MNSSMFWLLMTILMTAVMWIPYITDLVMKKGFTKAMTNVEPEDPKNLSAWARRAKAAHYNMVENLVLFAPLVIMAHVLRVNSPTFLFGVKLFFWARLGHYIVYAMGIPYARTATFAASWLGILIIIGQVFKVV